MHQLQHSASGAARLTSPTATGIYATGCETNLKTNANCSGCGLTWCNPQRHDLLCTVQPRDRVLHRTLRQLRPRDRQRLRGQLRHQRHQLRHLRQDVQLGEWDACLHHRACAPRSPVAGYGNCDGNVVNGCETATTNNVNACGGCGITCSAQNGTPAASERRAPSACTAPPPELQRPLLGRVRGQHAEQRIQLRCLRQRLQQHERDRIVHCEHLQHHLHRRLRQLRRQLVERLRSESQQRRGALRQLRNSVQLRQRERRVQPGNLPAGSV